MSVLVALLVVSLVDVAIAVDFDIGDLSALESLLRSWQCETCIQELTSMPCPRSTMNSTAPVRCDADGRIVALSLPRYGLRGDVFPKPLAQLRHLSSLLLSNNALTNKIDVEVLLKLTSLRSLRLHRNQIIGVLPSQIAQLTYLEVLSLRENFLQGPIPTQFARLTRLQELYLYGNRLSGAVPALKALKSLATCSLSCPENSCADGADNCFECPLEGFNGACIVSAKCGDCVELRVVVPTEPVPVVEPPPSSWLAPVLLCLGPLLGAMALMGLAWYNQRDFEKRNELARM